MDLLRIVTVAVALLVVSGGAARAQLLSPGPLSQAHAAVEGDASCGKCHASGKQIEPARCLACHEDLGARIAAGKGLHGTAYRGKPCADCHVEHNGRKVRLVRWPGGAPEKLDHALTGWKLDGAHAAQPCAKCHDKKNPRGAATFLGVTQSCNGCHRDPHAGRMGATCATCHSTVRWSDVRLAEFDHARTAFPLRGAHAQVACAKCHTGTPARYVGLAKTCEGCHQDPHAGRFPGACSSCHEEQSWQKVVGLRGNHPGLSLGGGHARVACATCHDKGNDKPPTKGASCVACHAPVHVADFGRNCKACHATIRWVGLPEKIGLDAHGQTRFPLTAAHAQVACGKCHPSSRPVGERFRGVRFARCADCHQDPHPGGLGRDCAACHDGSAFYPSKMTAALHQSFPLDGKHEHAPCLGCHAGARPRLAFKQPKRACAECHDNPHGTQFATEMAAGGCARCHSTLGWERPKVDHAIFPLTGAHAEAPCIGCHRGESYKGAPRACDACHVDPHAGQFRLTAPVRACDACHGTASFEIAAFDHLRLAGYALDGKHAAAKCEACHRETALTGGGGGKAVRWRLGYRKCRDCHADPHGGMP